MPNKLSGSDLDGDEYDLLIFPGLHPPRIYEPGEYPAAPKKTLQRDSTIKDVADFVVDFINNDMYVNAQLEGLLDVLIQILSQVGYHRHKFPFDLGGEGYFRQGLS